MIRHIVFFSAKNSGDIETIVDALNTYRAIPDVINFEVALNRKVDGISNEVDVILHAQFETEEALSAYKSHPIYLAGIDIVRPLRQLRIAADYEQIA